jgi:hypothetical protein
MNRSERLIRVDEREVRVCDGAQKHVTRMISCSAVPSAGRSVDVNISSPLPVVKSSADEVVDKMFGSLPQK